MNKHNLRPSLWTHTINLNDHRTSWIMLMPLGIFHHPIYGTLNFSYKKLEAFKQNFTNNVRKIDISLDVDHKAASQDSRATGWIKNIVLRPAGLWGEIEWTPYGKKLISTKEYKYFSPEFGSYTDEATKAKYENVLIGGALTNRPFLKMMPAVKLSDKKTREISNVIKRLSQEEIAMRHTLTAYQNALAKKTTKYAEDEEDEEEETKPRTKKASRKTYDKQEDDNDNDNDEDEEDEEDEEGECEDGDEEDEDEEEETKPRTKKASRKEKPMPKIMSRKTTEKRLTQKTATEQTRLNRKLAEQTQRLQDMEQRLYEQDIDNTLREWKNGKTLTLSAIESSNLPRTHDVTGPRITHKTRIQMTPKAAKKIREFLLDDGYQLTETSRLNLMDLIQTLLSETAFVETGSRTNSFDQEARRTRTSNKNDETIDNQDMTDLAEQLAAKDRKRLNELKTEEKMHYYIAAEKMLSA